MENEKQSSNPRFLVFLVLSFLIFLGWSVAYEKLFPSPKKTPTTVTQPALATDQTAANQGQNNSNQQTGNPSVAPVTTAPAPAPAAPLTELRVLNVATDFWKATLSNQGAVLTEWTMTRFTNGQEVDANVGGVNLVSARLAQEYGGALRFYIPSDDAAARELNAARFVVESPVENNLFIKQSETKEIAFAYNGNGLSARKKLIFRGKDANGGSGFDFDLIAEVTRNGQPLETYLVIADNFGDQSVVVYQSSYTAYKQPPQISYAIGSKVYREHGSNFGDLPKKDYYPVSWAAVDDNYFAMAIVPPQPVQVIGLNHKRTETIDNKPQERNLVAAAVRLLPGQVNHIYAGPKALDSLERLSAQFGLNPAQAGLEDIVSYGILDYVRWLVKPIARFMLAALRAINLWTHNWGWSIVVLTVLLNMFFFPLRWYSSKTMKKAAAMQPRMKELQDQMKDLPKDDPRALEIQRQQLALMKEGNPLLGCLPLLLQMPFFMAVFAILTVSIEVRHAPFFGWLKDLSSPDPLYLLPIIMCITMIAQTALTPTTADPVQKRISYIMPIALTYFFFISAPAGLVLYWMVGNLVGVVQQFIINRLTGGPTTPGANTTTTLPPASNESASAKKAKRKAAALANS